MTDAYPSAWQALRTMWRTVLGINRRNAEYLLPMNSPAIMQIVDNKVMTKQALEAAQIAVPQTLAVWRDRHDVHVGLDAAMTWHDCVIKPGRGFGGGGIKVVAAADGHALTLISGQRWDRAAVRDHCLDILDGVFALDEQPDLVLWEQRIFPDPVLQLAVGAEAATPHGAGLPDVRVILVRGVPILAMLRVPTKKSGGRANLHAGGLGVGIDIVTGTTCQGIYGNYGITRHPDTRRALAGVVIPHWSQLLQIATRCFDAVPLGYMGVDLVLDRAHGPLVLELNARPGLQVQLASQVGLRPLLEDLAATPQVPHSVSERIAFGCELFRKFRLHDSQ